jgi:cysteinyl-tRNA synthetase
MSCALLGQTFDIHGGGADLQFPHHENEIAQSEGASGQRLANYWLHNGFVRVDNEKMSKSLGNFFTIRDALARYDGETLRFFVVRTHYRSELPYSDAHLDDARAALRRLYTALAAGGITGETPAVAVNWADGCAQRFKAAMNEDFGTPDAMAVLFEMASEVNRTHALGLAQQLRALGGALGLLQQAPQAFLQAGHGLEAAAIERCIAERAQAKAAKNYARADEIRLSLQTQGVLLKDSPQGTTWERA